MTLKKCSNCNHDLSDEATLCPHCGAKVPQSWSPWKRLLVVIFGLGVIGQIGSHWGDSQKPVIANSANAPKPKTLHDEVKENIKFDFNWTKGGFDNVMLLNATITNNSAYPIKDLVIYCDNSGNSGTHIDENAKVVYERIASGKTLKLHEFNMGLIQSQSTQANCKISDFEIVQSKKSS